MFDNLAKFDIYTNDNYVYREVTVPPCTNFKGLEQKTANANFIIIKRKTGEEELIATVGHIKSVAPVQEA